MARKICDEERSLKRQREYAMVKENGNGERKSKWREEFAMVKGVCNGEGNL